jgi:hypothetical protein
MFTCNKKTVFIILVIIFVGIIFFLLSNNYNSNFNSNKTIELFDPTTTTTPISIPTPTPIPILSQDQIQYATDITNSNTLVSNVDTLNENINDINTVSSANARIKYNPIEMKRAIGNTLANNTDLLVNNVVNNANHAQGNKMYEQITTLQNQLTDLENIVNKMNNKKMAESNYTKVKSLNNGMELNLINQESVDNSAGIFGATSKEYLVNFNNGCLSVGQNNYDIYQCDPANMKQRFKMVHVLNDVSYSNNVDKLLPFTTIDTTNTKYPFVMLKSINNDNCLTNNHGNITVQPCTTLTAQQWSPIDDQNI